MGQGNDFADQLHLGHDDGGVGVTHAPGFLELGEAFRVDMLLEESQPVLKRSLAIFFLFSAHGLASEILTRGAVADRTNYRRVKIETRTSPTPARSPGRGKTFLSL